MNPLFTFVLGLLIGWLIEWLIDFFYWRTRYAEKEATYSQNMNSMSTTRTSSMGSVDLKSPPAVVEAVDVEPPVAKLMPDDLKLIKGIGTVIERRLNDAGVYTFEQLGNLSTAELRSILGNVIERLSNEESLLQQARDLARRK
jgi:predicted flap endonuclease-1-like 5' DNA nuclease